MSPTELDFDLHSKSMASTREDEELLVPQISRSVQTNPYRQSPVNKQHLLSLLEPYQVELCF